ncbi:HNH endonuclease [Hydrogenophaga aquatica]
MSAHQIIESLLERTIASPNGCRIFTGCTQSNGYGRAKILGKVDYTHRHMYRLIHGEIQPGLEVCHWCDVRGCINPEHLFLGTHTENMADAVKKNRIAKGFALPHTKLTESQRAEIQRLASSGMSYTQIGILFGISRHHASWIASKKEGQKHVISQ